MNLGKPPQIHAVYEFLIRRVHHLEELASYAARLVSLLSLRSAVPLDRWSLPSPVFDELTGSLGKIETKTKNLAKVLRRQLEDLVSIMMRIPPGETHVPVEYRPTALSIIEKNVELDRIIKGLWDETSLIRDCLEQRGLLREPNYHASEEAYIGGPAENQKLLRGVDAVLSYISRRMMPAQPVPIALAWGGQGYGIRAMSDRLTIATMPSADLLEPRFWPLFAHEFAHVLFEEAVHQNPTLQIERKHLAFKLALQAELVTLSGEEPESKDSLMAQITLLWIEEIVCDTMAVCVLGPAYSMAMAAILGPEDLLASQRAHEKQDEDPLASRRDHEEKPEVDIGSVLTAFGGHPPTAWRLKIQYQVLIALAYPRPFAHSLGLSQMIETTNGCLRRMGHSETSRVLEHFSKRAATFAGLAIDIVRDLVPDDDWCRESDVDLSLDSVILNKALDERQRRLLPALLFNALWRNRATVSHHIQRVGKEREINPMVCWRAVKNETADATSAMGAVVLALNRYLDQQQELS